MQAAHGLEILIENGKYKAFVQRASEADRKKHEWRRESETDRDQVKVE